MGKATARMARHACRSNPCPPPHTPKRMYICLVSRIAYKLVGFGGPSIILVRERESGAVWGGCADSPWKESNSFYGGGGSFLVRLSPDFQVMPSKIARRATRLYRVGCGEGGGEGDPGGGRGEVVYIMVVRHPDLTFLLWERPSAGVFPLPPKGKNVCFAIMS